MCLKGLIPSAFGSSESFHLLRLMDMSPDSNICRIDGHGVIKVADFGLTEDMYCTNYFRQDKSVVGSEERVPIRWMAPESIENDIYNESTDVVRTKMSIPHS